MPSISTKIWGEVEVLQILTLVVCPSCKGSRKRPGFVMGKPNPDSNEPCPNCSGDGSRQMWLTLDEFKQLLHAIGDH